ncbi:MAG TPA: segregation/condensation protein A [Verrucomicrobiae bacterium]|nr:segregation/condensation protein A [Verrucomicrobiae bacterium]
MNAPVQEPLLQTLDQPIRLPVFEGPLDLLLFLIRKNEIDIYDIPIGEVTRQYLEILHAMEKLDLDVAGDFFVMAATLMHIKSRLLLPKHEQDAQPLGEDEEEHLDPRWGLVQQLLEYQKIKDAAAGLQVLIARAQEMLPREFRISDEDRLSRPLEPTDRLELWNTFNLLLRRLSEKMVHGEIHRDHVTVADRMEFVLQRCEHEASFTFTSLLPERPSSVIIVATFLAILELTRLRKLDLRQTVDFSDIEITRREEIPPPSEPAVAAVT